MKRKVCIYIHICMYVRMFICMCIYKLNMWEGIFVLINTKASSASFSHEVIRRKKISEVSRFKCINIQKPLRFFNACISVFYLLLKSRKDKNLHASNLTYTIAITTLLCHKISDEGNSLKKLRKMFIFIRVP